MEGNTKRKAKRTYEKVSKGDVPFMSTEELAARHISQFTKESTKEADNENGKEDFDDLLFMMSKPDLD